MATTLDTELIPEILEIIQELGITGTFTTQSSTDSKTYNATTGSGTESTTDYTEEISPILQYNERYIDGDLIQKEDSYIYLAASGISFTPIKDMIVTILSIVWNVVEIKPIYTGEEIGAYKLQLRK